MKLRLIQLTGLFAFVVVILMLAPPDKGFGGDPSAHMPDIWINTDGHLDTPDNRGPHLIGQPEDPRGRSFNEMCGTTNDESVSGLAWYYSGGTFNKPEAHAADPHGPNHDTEFVQNVYKLYLNGSASTSAKEASGSLDPGIEDAEAIELPAAHKTRSFKGLGRIKLDIYITNYHIPRYFIREGMALYYIGCSTRTTDFYYFRPKEDAWKVIKVLVNIENVKDKRTAAIDLGVELKGAKGNFTHSWEWEKGWFNTKGRGFGMNASVGGGWIAYRNPEIKLQHKRAVVEGWLESASLPNLIAQYDIRKSVCPPDTGYSQTQRVRIPHLHLTK